VVVGRGGLLPPLAAGAWEVDDAMLADLARAERGEHASNLGAPLARAKGIDHPVAGNADILLVPTIEAGNLLGKAFTWLAHRPVGHVILGARAPVLIPSRVESAEDKLLSIALGVVAAARAQAARANPAAEE